MIYILISLSISISAGAQLPVLNEVYLSVIARTKGKFLTVSTGKMQRTWEWTGKGFTTISVKNLETGKEWKASQQKPGADWAYYGLINETPGKLISLTASQDNDNDFTSDFLKVVAEVSYPTVESAIKYEIWLYPGATGIRTQLFIKGNGAKYLKDIQYTLPDKTVNFKVTSGSISAFSGKVSKATDPKAVEVLMANLKSSGEYTLGISFSSENSSALSQKIRISNIDREIQQVLIERAEADNKMQSFMAKLPSKLLAIGSVRLYADKISGEKASLSEIWLYEKGNSASAILNGNSDRIEELQRKAPDGTFLAAYYNFSSSEDNKVQQFGRTDFLPVSPMGMSRSLIGYYNDTQNRNTRETPLIKEEIIKRSFQKAESYNWANILSLEDRANGIMLVKESHKCVNQYGVETGDFEIKKEGIFNRGISLYPDDITPDEYKWCWATWSVVYKAGEANRQLALKEFDRIRYPIDPERDIYIQANTWGSGRDRSAAEELNVLTEIDRQAELGIDIQQIDDGWQDKNWYPATALYPKGWKNVVARAKEKNVKLGLWAAAMPITLGALKHNYDNGHFISYKLDFAKLNNHKEIDETINKVRTFIDYTNHKVRINWDVTENAPRFGFFWAREYGCVYLENRKPRSPVQVVYIPYLVLRDLWHLSKYTNINKFQTTIQNVDMVDAQLSDAPLHSNPYAVAIGLIGTPLFFQETRFYKNEEVEKIKPILAAYKQYRNDIYSNYTFPIGNEPDNTSYTGFQNYNEEEKRGYLFLFREINNKEQQHTYQLEFIKNKQLTLTDILSKEKTIVSVDAGGKIIIGISKPAGFRIFKFEILD